VSSTHPLVVAGPVGTTPQTLRQLTVSPGHFTDFVVLTPGTWRFVVTTRFGSPTVTFAVRHSVG
jgi:hypothetical protein